MSRRLAPASAALTTTLLLLASTPATVIAQPPVPDRFTATTTDMTPAEVTLRIDVMTWSDDAARAAVISTLNGEADRSESLAQLPTIGYVWSSGSPVGYALKYAHRMPSSGDGERITFVTEKPVGAYGFRPWAANNPPTPNALDYSVIELYLDGEGSGVGTMSLAAEVVFDHGSQTVLLSEGDTTNVLTEARREPKPYWAQDG